MPSISTLVVEALRIGCEVDRIAQNILAAVGYRRNFYSSKGQDRWITERVFPSYRGGYFVDIGAADGLTHSNTYVLERDLGWTGIAVEANPKYIPGLQRNRKCRCIHSCVDGYDGDVDFLCLGFMGGIVDDDTDNAPKKRRGLINKHQQRITTMRAVSLQKILDASGSPSMIDYLSIDVEGAEYRLLSTFPFDRFQFGAITVERPTAAVHKLLRDAGYVLDRVYRCDGFYVSQTRASMLKLSAQTYNGIAPKSF